MLPWPGTTSRSESPLAIAARRSLARGRAPNIRSSLAHISSHDLGTGGRVGCSPPPAEAIDDPVEEWVSAFRALNTPDAPQTELAQMTHSSLDTQGPERECGVDSGELVNRSMAYRMVSALGEAVHDPLVVAADPPASNRAGAAVVAVAA